MSIGQEDGNRSKLNKAEFCELLHRRVLGRFIIRQGNLNFKFAELIKSEFVEAIDWRNRNFIKSLVY